MSLKFQVPFFVTILTLTIITITMAETFFDFDSFMDSIPFIEPTSPGMNISDMGTCLLSAKPGEDGIENFLLEAMQKYPAWLRENNLDPFVDEDISSTAYYAGGGIQNMQLQRINLTILNHSNLNSELTTSEKSVNLGNVEINYKITDVPVQFSGNYKVTGKIWGKPFSGDGKWSGTAAFSPKYNASLHYRMVMNNLEETPEGFVAISYPYFFTDLFIEPTFDFDGLIVAKEYVNEVKESLRELTLSWLNGWQFAPLQKMIDMYFSNVFKESPVCEINKMKLEYFNQ